MVDGQRFLLGLLLVLRAEPRELDRSLTRECRQDLCQHRFHGIRYVCGLDCRQPSLFLVGGEARGLFVVEVLDCLPVQLAPLAGLLLGPGQLLTDMLEDLIVAETRGLLDSVLGLVREVGLARQGG